MLAAIVCFVPCYLVKTVTEKNAIPGYFYWMKNPSHVVNFIKNFIYCLGRLICNIIYLQIKYVKFLFDTLDITFAPNSVLNYDQT